MSHGRIPLPVDPPVAALGEQPGVDAKSETACLPAVDLSSIEPMTVDEVVALKEKIVEKLHTCFDPEIPVNIYELGLIYDIKISPKGEVEIGMTLTSPACPVAGTLPGEVQRKVQTVDRVTTVKVDLVWEPMWTKDRMSEAAKLQLGIDD